jgi:transposase-like protein
LTQILYNIFDWHFYFFVRVNDHKKRYSYQRENKEKAIHASEDVVAAREKAIRVIEKLRGLRLSKAAELAEAEVEETLTYYAFPEQHWRRIRTNNPLERISSS